MHLPFLFGDQFIPFRHRIRRLGNILFSAGIHFSSFVRHKKEK